jgi:hypothetical protein
VLGSGIFDVLLVRGYHLGRLPASAAVVSRLALQGKSLKKALSMIPTLAVLTALVCWSIFAVWTAEDLGI